MWWDRIFGSSRAKRRDILQDIQRKFSVFRQLLDRHNQVLKLVSRLEEKHKDRRLDSIVALWDEFVEIREGVSDIIERMIELGGSDYLILRERLSAISHEVEALLPQARRIPADEYIIPFGRLNRDRANSVGGKNANLGEIKSRVKLPVPDGFAISAWAYQHFIDVNDLSERIRRLLATVRIRKYEHLETVSEEIQELVIAKPVPADLAAAIRSAFNELSARTGRDGFALRSSAVGEDSAFTFAGQYRTYLNVRRDDLLERYKQILASKFTPAVIYYLSSHSLAELDLAMGVACMEMVDAASSGVVYTHDPVHPAAGHVLINAIFGLGIPLVNGTVTPDVFHVSRADGSVVYASVARKPTGLRLSPDGGVQEYPIAPQEQSTPSLTTEQLGRLAQWGVALETHFGEPQDIEWALDRSGELYLLQTRPLRTPPPKTQIQVPSDVDPVVLLQGGTPISSGAGVGPVYHVNSPAALGAVPDGVVLVAPNPSPYLVAVMRRISGLITMVGGSASHLATIARELSVPTIAGMNDALRLPAGRPVTMDATHGVVYDGAHPDWVVQPGQITSATTTPVGAPLLDAMIAPIVHLDVIHPSDPRFTAENCRTLHDITRFIHQKAMESIFAALRGTKHKNDIGLRLKTKIPLWINIIYLDRDYDAVAGRRWEQESEIASQPMKSLWDGILLEGWPESQVPADLRGFLAVVGANIQGGHQPEFSENSYAFLSQEYMLLNLRMGYHFSTIEAIAASEPEKNYIRMQFKLGGAPLERRIRRVWLIAELLKRMGFENSGQGDFLDSLVAYRSRREILDRLHLLGRLTILTKQLDMTLSSDARAQWYLNEIAGRLGLKVENGSDGDEMRR
ncbi:MAG: PEP/pyruvate-binding domain-containing protein [Candidatus Zixiibacteriota bacterium]